MNLLTVTDLTKKYKDFKAVNSISFSIPKGEIFALIGPNGAGKSTTLKIIATILQPTSGKITLENKDFKNMRDDVRKMITYLPEEAGAYKNMKGIDYLNFMAQLYSTSKAEATEAIKFARELSDLGNKLRDKISTYSKGMTRKLLLARALMSKPKLAILDEPTSGLDVINALHIRRTIKQMSKLGMTVLLSSHNMLEIEFLSDRVAIIDKGEIIEIGEPNELMKKHNAKNLEEVFSNLTQKQNE
ncbi:MAG: ABC-type sodium efflux pump system, ATPase component [candidate division WS6 bacterium GW2011_GWF2_39_15]|uniref:ABC-type sodium efflux pump system, ATPase component n=1 Tax=candidate division WS6 bacterium GW2011_GWF2_39_15 TaxID=1619100 RepID=A0A0G0MZX8_9BACT|nr:MAG: ABC-type sodium efflux pump system, ATPase component [candidate division WS6 bacterium GW2011_GWF2_39_15]